MTIPDVARASTTVNDSEQLHSQQFEQLSFHKSLESYIEESRLWRSVDLLDGMCQMSALIKKFGYSIPNPLALETISDLLKIQNIPGIVEIGAGAGYWARCLEGLGIEVRPYDLSPPDKTWTTVYRGNETNAKLFADHALMLCCPPADVGPADPSSKMASLVLNQYREAGGKYLIFVGERELIQPFQKQVEYSKTGDFDFHKELCTDWTLLNEVCLPNWHHWTNKLSIFKLCAN